MSVPRQTVLTMWYFVSFFQSKRIRRCLRVHVYLLSQNVVNVNCTEESCRLRRQHRREKELTRLYSSTDTQHWAPPRASYTTRGAPHVKTGAHVCQDNLWCTLVLCTGVEYKHTQTDNAVSSIVPREAALIQQHSLTDSPLAHGTVCCTHQTKDGLAT